MIRKPYGWEWVERLDGVLDYVRRCWRAVGGDDINQIFWDSDKRISYLYGPCSYAMRLTGCRVWTTWGAHLMTADQIFSANWDWIVIELTAEPVCT